MSNNTVKCVMFRAIKDYTDGMYDYPNTPKQISDLLSEAWDIHVDKE